jgi:hypothetical protein
MMETGRNDPCPCGSGRKYKKCCLKTLEPDRDQEWRRLGEAYGDLDDRLRSFTERTLGREGLTEAYDEFLLWPDEAPDPEFLNRQGPLFCSWSIFNWAYDPENSEVRLDLPPGLTPAELFLKKEGRRLGEAEKGLLEAILRKPFSFFEVIRCDSGRGFLLKDVLTEKEIEVLEQSASASARVGDILFGRVVEIQGMAMLYGCSSYAFPPDWKPSIIELRKWMRQGRRKITEETLNEYDFEIREEYLRMSTSLFRLPTICNTDGDLLNLHTLHYEIDSPDPAFSKLAGLCATESAAELRSLAKLDGRGGIAHVEIPWTRKGYKNKPASESTLLGTLVIDGASLKVTVNSAERAEKAKKEIETRLGAGARYKTTVIRSTEYMLKEQRLHGPGDATHDTDHDKLMQHPEVSERLAAMLAAHWEGWVDDKITALGGKTPRQAVKTADGRESVEALLLAAGRKAAEDKHMGEAILKAIHDVRQRLKLDRR